LKREIWKIYLSDFKQRGGGGGILMNLNRKGCVRGMQQQLENLETISEFFEFIKPKISALAWRHRKNREKSGSITRKKSNSTSLSNVLRFSKKKKTFLFESSQASPVCLSGNSNT